MPSSCPFLSPPEAEPPCLAGSWGLSTYSARGIFCWWGKDRARATCTSFAPVEWHLFANPGKWDAHPWKGVCEEAASDAEKSQALWCLRHPASGPCLAPGARDPRKERPQPATHPPSPLHFPRTFCWLRVTPQMGPNAALSIIPQTRWVYKYLSLFLGFSSPPQTLSTSHLSPGMQAVLSSREAGELGAAGSLRVIATPRSEPHHLCLTLPSHLADHHSGHAAARKIN